LLLLPAVGREGLRGYLTLALLLLLLLHLLLLLVVVGVPAEVCWMAIAPAWAVEGAAAAPAAVAATAAARLPMRTQQN
jgi:hypothetical protein